MEDLWGVILAWCKVLDMADLMPFMCFDRSSVGVSCLFGRMLGKEMLVSIWKYSSSNDLRVVEL